MPEYLAPGVYVEETSFRQKTIEGVSTSTAGFVGPTRFGPVRGEPELLTSFLDFERIYGGIDQLEFDGARVHNHLAHAVRGFFENGGRRLYVARAYEDARAGQDDDHTNVASYPLAPNLEVRARYPGSAGNVLVRFELLLSDDILVVPDGGGPASLAGGLPFDTVLLTSTGANTDPPSLHWIERDFDEGHQLATFRLRSPGGEVSAGLVTDLDEHEVRVVTVAVTVTALGRFMDAGVFDELAPHREHRNGLGRTFEPPPTRRSTELYVPIVLDTSIDDGVGMVEALVDNVVWPDGSLPDSLPADAAELLDERFVGGDRDADGFGEPLEITCLLQGGADGTRPNQAAYLGLDLGQERSGLRSLEGLDDVSIVAAPGSTSDILQNGSSSDGMSIQQHLINHAERMRYRIAVLDSPDGAILSQIRDHRGKLDSTHAALYYPWITISDPVTETEIDTPPSGFIAGIYARNDVERGVHKAPANEIVQLAVDFEFPIDKSQQEVLNPRGINCLRFFDGRGYRVWGARTITSDPEWKYVPLRRYFAFLEHSIDRGTQWAVFEPNGSALWTNIRRTVEDFLFNEWKSGHLMGATPDEAYFVKCDRSTMTQNDIDNGRLICLIGVAPLRPAEFVIFRIGQKTLTGMGGS